MKRFLIFIVSLVIIIGMLGSITVFAADNNSGGMKALKEKIVQLEKQVAELLLENNGMKRAIAILIEESNSLIDERNTLIDEKNALIDERNTILAEKNAIIEEKNILNDKYMELAEQLNIAELWQYPIAKADVIGNWNTVGYVNKVTDFDYTNENTDLFLKSMNFLDATVVAAVSDGGSGEHSWLDNQ